MDYTAQQVEDLSPCQAKQVELGSKLQLVAWYTYFTLIWLLKATMLFFFYRITHGLSQQRLVKMFSVVTALAYIVTILTITLSCLPYSWNWAVRPFPPKKCTFKLQNLYVGTALNVSTDLMILAIPLPLLWGTTMRLAKKIALTLLLCSGIFIITAAIFRFAFTIAGLSGITLNKWGTRETAVGTIAVTIPILRPLFKWPLSSNNERNAAQIASTSSSPNRWARYMAMHSIGSGPTRMRPNDRVSCTDHTTATESSMYKSTDLQTTEPGKIGPDHVEDSQNNGTECTAKHMDLETSVSLAEVREEDIPDVMPSIPPPLALK